MSGITITCESCRSSFLVSDDELTFYASRNLSAPRHCKSCRDARKNQRRPRQMYDAVCAKCNQPCQVPFEPREGGKPALCLSCFRASKGE